MQRSLGCWSLPSAPSNPTPTVSSASCRLPAAARQSCVRVRCISSSSEPPVRTIVSSTVSTLHPPLGGCRSTRRPAMLLLSQAREQSILLGGDDDEHDDERYRPAGKGSLPATLALVDRGRAGWTDPPGGNLVRPDAAQDGRRKHSAAQPRRFADTAVGARTLQRHLYRKPGATHHRHAAFLDPPPRNGGWQAG